ncbi:hypothetical protein B7494_g1523 [Chlorociboria aeruginascens]|nr:hypothetical protein B7494_g1523 [Chlorociboria aeruginascens]
MEPSPKRQRLYASFNSDAAHSFQDHYDVYETPNSELDYEEDALIAGKEEEKLEQGGVYDPDEELEHRRARLDLNLKSTFESIFDKYGRDFDGIGDEIDLSTGQIVVNNGHLLAMQDERDAGDIVRRRTRLRDLDPDIDEFETADDEDEDGDEEIEDGDGAEDKIMSDEDMGDDMILQGIEPPRRREPIHHEPSQGTVSSNTGIADSEEDLERVGPSSPSLTSGLPSLSEMLAQFGPQMGPQIFKYVSQQQRQLIVENIEPAWRVPGIPSLESGRRPIPQAAPGRRPILKSVILQPEPEKSPSPDAGPSVWAPVRPPGRRRKDGADNDAIFRGENVLGNRYHGRMPSKPHRESPLSKLAQNFGQPRKQRNPFTAQDDEVLTDWVAKAMDQGKPLSSPFIWKALASKNPRHTSVGWRSRFNKLRENLDPDDDSQLSASGVPSESNDRRYEEIRVRKSRLGAINSALYSTHKPDIQRPARIRKPAQKDHNIVSWTEAVATIESLDAESNSEYAGLLQDARNARSSVEIESPISSSTFSQEQHYPKTIRLTHQTFSRQQHKESSYRNQNGYPEILDSARNEVPKSVASDHANNEEEEIIVDTEEERCPHAACKNYPAIQYGLRQLQNGEPSPMATHLLDTHHTTPFPCGELGCEHKGTHGYFKQTDLVNHVKTAHPYNAALQRLRGRVGTELLESSDRFASSPDATRQTRDEDADYLFPRSPQVNRFRFNGPPVNAHKDKTPIPHHSVEQTTLAPVSNISEASNTSTGYLEDIHAPQSAVEPCRSSNTPIRRHLSHRTRRTFSSCTKSITSHNMARHLDAHERKARFSITPRPSPKPNQLPSSLPDSQSSSELTRSLILQQPVTSQGSPKQISSDLDNPSYTFSEAVGRLGKLSRGLSQAPRLSESMPETNSSPPKPQYTIPEKPIPTPKNTSQVRVYGEVVDLTDLDELSLGPDEFALMFSRPKSANENRPIHPQTGIKMEKSNAIETPHVERAVTSTKRKRRVSTDEDELDELCLELPRPPSFTLGLTSRPGPQIKTKTEAPPSITTEANIFASTIEKPTREMKRLSLPEPSSNPNGIHVPCASHLPTPHSTTHTFSSPTRPRQILYTPRAVNKHLMVFVTPDHTPMKREKPNTPLLDLMPSQRQRERMKEREREEEKARRKREKGKRRDDTGIVAVKTPCGTMKKCGVDGFTCGRSFCLRCGSMAVDDDDS